MSGRETNLAPVEPKQVDTFNSTYSFNVTIQNYIVCSSLGKSLRLSAIVLYV